MMLFRSIVSTCSFLRFVKGFLMFLYEMILVLDVINRSYENEFVSVLTCWLCSDFRSRMLVSLWCVMSCVENTK